MKIILRLHLKVRLKERKIPLDYPIKIITEPEEMYSDNITQHFISIKKLAYNGKMRPMVAAYDIIGEEIEVITIYPTTDQEIKNRINRNRWSKDEKN